MNTLKPTGFATKGRPDCLKPIGFIQSGRPFVAKPVGLHQSIRLNIPKPTGFIQSIRLNVAKPVGLPNPSDRMPQNLFSETKKKNYKGNHSYICTHFWKVSFHLFLFSSHIEFLVL
jgi:hypothetical protein